MTDIRTPWTPPYPAPNGWSWREQGGRHYLAHKRAVIGKEARIGEGAQIGRGAVIGEGVVIGEEAVIGERAEIGEGAVIGEWAQIGERARIDEGAQIGQWAVIGKWGRGYQSGRILKYHWSAYRAADGTAWLYYGCEGHRLDEWPGQLVRLCAKHEPEHSGLYERAIGALVAALPALLEATDD